MPIRRQSPERWREDVESKSFDLVDIALAGHSVPGNSTEPCIQAGRWLRMVPDTLVEGEGEDRQVKGGGVCLRCGATGVATRVKESE